jgi:hypothetical protein
VKTESTGAYIVSCRRLSVNGPTTIASTKNAPSP